MAVARAALQYMSTSAAPMKNYVPVAPGADDDRFARTFKGWREWNVVVNFLSNLHFDFDEMEVLATTADPPDVVFRDARFEVKEIMDKGRRRHDEVRAARARAETNGDQIELLHYTPKDIEPLAIADLIDEVLPKLTYQPAVRQQLDLLFYVNKLEHWFKSGALPATERFSSSGYRSISAVFATQQSMVFFASADAPPFLRDSTGRVRDRWEEVPSEGV